MSETTLSAFSFLNPFSRTKPTGNTHSSPQGQQQIPPKNQYFESKAEALEQEMSTINPERLKTDLFRSNLKITNEYGTLYKGFIKEENGNPVPHGHGTSYGTDTKTIKYVGNWENGEPHGEGVMYYCREGDLSKYKSWFRNNYQEKIPRLEGNFDRGHFVNSNVNLFFGDLKYNGLVKKHGNKKLRFEAMIHPGSFHIKDKSSNTWRSAYTLKDGESADYYFGYSRNGEKSLFIYTYKENHSDNEYKIKFGFSEIYGSS
jgi:hypothetical protein